MKKSDFRNHVRISSILWYLGATGIIIGGYLSEPLQPNWIFWAGITVFFSSVIYRILMIKCPHCGSNMFSCRQIPKHCPDCGKELN